MRTNMWLTAPGAPQLLHPVSTSGKHPQAACSAGRFERTPMLAAARGDLGQYIRRRIPNSDHLPAASARPVEPLRGPETPMSFSMTEGAASPTLNATRLKRQLTEQAIAAATDAEWAAAADLNKRILELGADSEAENRLAKAYWEMGELATAREHYQAALALDPTNRIAERNISRLRMLLAEAGKKTAGVTSIGERDVRIIIRETYQDPANYGKVSFPTAAKVSDLRPYTKGTLVREEMDLEDELELDDEEDEVQDIGRILPADVTEDEAF